MNAATIALVTLVVFAWGLLSARLGRADLSAPIVFVAVGLLLSDGLHVMEPETSREVVKVLAEVTLVWVLFADAARVGLRELRADRGLYARLLAVGLPLTIAAGALLAMWAVRRHGDLAGPAGRCRAGTHRRGAGCGGDDRSGGTGTGAAGPERGKRAQRRHRDPGRDGRDRGRRRRGGPPGPRPGRRVGRSGRSVSRSGSSSVWWVAGRCGSRGFGDGRRRTSPGRGCWRWRWRPTRARSGSTATASSPRSSPG